ncbi:tyrosine-type recombinase/integrase [Aminobacterium sp.]|nr:tyrosine-type recombinase/integrase [Aminobacterium sp.]
MKLTNTLILKSQAKEKRYSLSDTETTGLIVRIEPSGSKSFYVDYRNSYTGKRVQRRLGYTNELTVTQARELAQKIRVSVRNDGEDPTQIEKKMRERLTIGEIVNLYVPWLKIHRKSVRQTLIMLRSFSKLYPIVAEEITSNDVTKWKQNCKNEKTGKSLAPQTVNRRLALFKGMFSWAMREGHISQNPLKSNVEMLKESDNNHRIRYLEPDERERLLTALEKRDGEEKDYLRCAVLLSLNTGVRKGTLLRLKWEYVDWERKTLFLPAQIMKGGKTHTVPLNSVALEALADWKKRSKNPSDGYIFPGDTPEGHLGDIKNPWETLLKRANIKNFRWHDMRHDFASQLVMQGVDILTVKKLMCHTDLKMTQIYAHLSPQHINLATEKLSELYSKNKGK